VAVCSAVASVKDPDNIPHAAANRGDRVTSVLPDPGQRHGYVSFHGSLANIEVTVVSSDHLLLPGFMSVCIVPLLCGVQMCLYLYSFTGFG
jgi:hypothetical protein